MDDILKIKSRKEWVECIWQEFLKSLLKAQSAKHLKNTLENIISAKEKKYIINRLIAISLIAQGKTYREIGEILWLSPNTISAIKKSFLGKSIYRSYQVSNGRKIGKKIKKGRNISWNNWNDFNKDFLDFIIKVSSKIPPLPPISGKGRWNNLNK